MGDVDGAMARGGARKLVAHLDVHLSGVLLVGSASDGALDDFASLQEQNVGRVKDRLLPVGVWAAGT